jgi:hypothetical protein
MDPGETINLASDPTYAELVAELSLLLNGTDPAFAGDGWKQAGVDAPAAYPLDPPSWKEGYDTPGLPEGALNFLEDPDHDGWLNIFEYKFGTHPLEADQPAFEASLSGMELVLTYPEVLARTGASLQLVQAIGLDAASWDSSGISIEETGSSGHATIREASSALAGERLFMRLQADVVE